MKTTQRIVLAAMLVSALTACDPASRVSDKDIKPIEYPRLIKLLDDPKTKVVLVDARPPAAYAKGHLRGAVNLFLPELRERDPRLAKADYIVVYGSGDRDDPLTPTTAKALIKLGYGGVRAFQGGLVKWEAEGGRVVSPTTAE